MLYKDIENQMIQNVSSKATSFVYEFCNMYISEER